MKNLRLILGFVLLLLVQSSFSQENWTGKYKMIVDPDNANSVIVQIIPDMDGNAGVFEGSDFILVLDPDLAFTTHYDYGYIWNPTESATGPMPGEECGRLVEWDLVVDMPNFGVTAGEPVNIVRIEFSGGGDCPFGKGVRFYDRVYNPDLPDVHVDWDTCQALWDLGLTNSLVIGTSSGAITGVLNGSDNPLTCPCDAPDAPSIAVTQPDCGETTGSVMVNNPLDSVLYTLLKDSVFEASDSSGEFTALTPGEYGILVTEGTCTSDTSFFTINEVSELPVISVSSTGNPAECGGEGTIVLGFTGVEDGIYDIEYDGGVFENVDVMDNSATISAPAGAYQNIRITAGDCTSAEGVNVSLSDPDAPEAPVVSVAAAECGVAGSASISNFDADLTYNFTPAGPSVDAEGNISGLSAGTGYVVTSTSEGCESEASAAFEIDEALEIPDAPVVSVTAAECGVAGSASIDNFDEALTYTFAPTGPTVDSEGNISGLTAGTEYTVTAGDAGGSSEASVGFEIDEALEVPVAPIVSVTAADCGIDGSASIDNFDEALAYSFTPTGPSVDAEGNISGLTAGTEYTVTAGDGDCVSETSDSFEIEEALEIPDAPVVSVTAADCDAAGSASIDNFDEALTYTFAPTGPTVDAEGNISGLTAGTEYTVTSGEGDCTSEASASFEIDEALEVPVAPIVSVTPAVCGIEGSASIDNFDEALTYTFAPTGPTVDSEGNINGLTAGTEYTVTAGDGDCVSEASAAFEIDEALEIPDAPVVSVTAADCGVAGSAAMDSFDEALTYTFAPTGPTVDSEGNISGLTAGTEYTVTSVEGDCSSEASVGFEIDEALEVPVAPIVSVTPADCGIEGSASIDNFDEALTYSFTPTGPSVDAEGNISGLTAGTEYTVTAGDGDCESEASASFEIDEALVIPDAPVVSVTAAECGVAGSASIDNFDEALTYTFAPTGPTVDSEGNISGLIAGTEYTVTSGEGDCTSEASASFEIDEALEVPDAPVVSVTVADCGIEGSASIDNFDEALTYSFTPTGPSVDAEGNISGLTAGTEYTVTAGDGDCVSEASAAFEIDEALEVPDAPVVSVTAADCGAEGSASIDNFVVAMYFTFATSHT